MVSLFTRPDFRFWSDIHFGQSIKKSSLGCGNVCGITKTVGGQGVTLLSVSCLMEAAIGEGMGWGMGTNC